jgi:PAS domain-containing protein
MTPLQNGRGDYRGQVGFILDNTERDADEAARRMLTTLVEHSPDLVAVTDETGELRFINGTGRNLLGLSEGIDIGEINLLERLLEGQPKNGDVRLRFPLREGEHVDLPVLTRNLWAGEKIHLCCAFFTIPPPKRDSSMLLAFVAQDVTKEAESELKLSLQENRRLLEENKILQERLQHENISLQERNLALQNEIADIHLPM